MRVSAKADYALRALIEIANRDDGRPVSAEELGNLQEIPHGFLQAILADMRRAGIVASQRGSVGGYWLAVPAASVTVADVIRTVEGPLADVRGEALEDLDYPGPAASLRDVWVATRASLRAVLEQVTIADVAGAELPEEIRRLTETAGAWVRRPSS